MEKKGSLALWLETKGHFFVHDQRNDEREREKEKDPFTRSVSSEFSTWLRHARINDFLIHEHYFFPRFHSSLLRQPNQPNYFSVLLPRHSSDTFTRVLHLTDGLSNLAWRRPGTAKIRQSGRKCCLPWWISSRYVGSFGRVERLRIREGAR